MTPTTFDLHSSLKLTVNSATPIIIDMFRELNKLHWKKFTRLYVTILNEVIGKNNFDFWLWVTLILGEGQTQNLIDWSPDYV